MSKAKWVALVSGLLWITFSVNAQQTNPWAFADTIPMGGNAYAQSPAKITDKGLLSVANAATASHIYFRVSKPQTFSLALRLKTEGESSTVKLSSGQTILQKQISATEYSVVDFGKLEVSQAGYVTLRLQNIAATNKATVQVSDLIIQYTQLDTALVYVKKGSSFHFGRRGPSVHLNYIVPDNLKNAVSWFYTELEIPKGEDKLGSYFMANGFGQGYFGMQVNSATERRVLFSVWSPFETDDPKSVPDSLKIHLLKKGEQVVTNNFGGEGSGGQSFMRFNWVAGHTYGFLLHGQPDSLQNTTTYTAYFKDMSANKWYLIASFKRPQITTYLQRLYSFLENFVPETGNETRWGLYKNQWAANSHGEWQELTAAKFTVDATARGGFRKDYAGGVKGDNFYMQNAGFFNEFVQPNQIFNRKALGKAPAINFAELP